MAEMEEDSVIVRLKNICADLETVEVEAVIFFCDMRSSSVIPTFCGTAEVSDMARKSTAGEAFLAEFLRLCHVIHARKKEKILSIEQAATEHTGEGIPLEMSVDEVTNDDEKSLQPGGESHERRAAENRGQPLVQGSELLLDQKPPCAQTMCEQEGTKSSIDSVVNYNKDPTNSAKSIVRNDDVTVKREIISGESDYHETMSTTENEQNCQVRVKTEPVDPDDIVNFNTSEMTNTSKSDMSSGSQFSTAGNQHTAASTSSLHVPVTQVKTVKLIPRAAPEQGNSGGPVITPVDKNRMLVIHPMYGTTSLSNSPVPTNRVQSIAIKNVIPITSTTTDSSELSPRASSGVPSAASQTLALSQKGSTGQVANEMSENNKRSLIAKPSAVSVEPASKRFKPGTSEGRTTRRTPFRDKMTVSNVGSESEECVEKTGDISANSSHSSKMIDMGPRTRGQSKSVEEIESEKNPQRSSASSASRKQRIPSSPSDGASLSPGGTGNARAQSRTEHEATSEDDDDDDWQEDEEFNKLSSEEITESPESPVHPKVDVAKRSRFSRITEGDLEKFMDASQSKSTKRNTTWANRLFQEWYTEQFGSCLDMTAVSTKELSEKLEIFYCETKTKSGGQYHKNTIKNIRAGLNRYLTDIGRNIDIVKDFEFKRANQILNGMLKLLARSGLAKPTRRASIIVHNDLQKIANYFFNAELSPLLLRQAVWYYLSVSFESRGLEFHKQLQISSLEFNTDEKGVGYVTLSQEFQQKYSMRGMYHAPSGKRMYATGLRDCPVRLLRLMIKRTVDTAVSLFNKCAQEALFGPEGHDIWYSNQPLSKRSFINFMPDIARSSGCSQRYTTHCLLVTAKSTDRHLASFHQRQEQ